MNHARAMKLFKKLEELDLANQDLAGRDFYEGEMKTAQRFHLLSFFGCSATFRMAL